MTATPDKIQDYLDDLAALTAAHRLVLAKDELVAIRGALDRVRAILRGDWSTEC